MATLVVGPLGSLQVGEQSAIGTPQTAPALELMGQGVTLAVDEPQSRFDEVRGRGIAANDLDPIITNNTAVLTHPQPLTAEALLLPLHACFGDVTPTTPGSATNAREWLWEFSPEANMEQNLYTFNCVERDEAETPNVYQTQVSDGYLQTLQIQWDATANAVGTVTATYQTNRATYGGSFVAATADQDFNPIPPNMTLLARRHVGGDAQHIADGGARCLQRRPNAHERSDDAHARPRQRRFRLRSGRSVRHRADDDDAGHLRGHASDGAVSGAAGVEGGGGAASSLRCTAAAAVSRRGSPTPSTSAACFTHMPESLTQHGTVDGDGRATMTIQLQSMHDATSGHNVFARTRNAAQAFP